MSSGERYTTTGIDGRIYMTLPDADTRAAGEQFRVTAKKDPLRVQSMEHRADLKTGESVIFAVVEAATPDGEIVKNWRLT